MEARQLPADLASAFAFPPAASSLLYRFLDEVQSHSNVNKMSVQNLATVFGPNILRPQIEDPVTIMEGNGGGSAGCCPGLVSPWSQAHLRKHRSASVQPRARLVGGGCVPGDLAGVSRPPPFPLPDPMGSSYERKRNFALWMGSLGAIRMAGEAGGWKRSVSLPLNTH